MSDIIKTQRDGAIVTIVIDDPSTRNALSPELTSGLTGALMEADADQGVSCIILSAAGEVFCAGGNIKAMYARSGHFAGSAVDIRRTYLTGVQTIARTFNQIEVPVIAAVNGAAMGAGLDIALMCQIRVAVDTARFAESFIKLGLTSAAGGAWFLNRAIGTSAAAEMTLTGDTIDAAEALRLGIVSRVVPKDQLMPTARSIADRIVRNPPHAIRLNTKLLREAARLDLHAALEMGASIQALAQQTEDQYEAVAAAVEKRAPVFKGR